MKRVAGAMVLLGAVAWILGCTRSDNSRRISAITAYDDVDIMTERVGLEESANRQHMELRPNGSHNRDSQRQVELVKAAVVARNNGITINPASEIAVNASLRDALAAGIPVVVMIHPVKMTPAPHLYFLLEDPAAGATLVTERLNTLLKGRGEVALFGLNPLYPGSAERFQSMELAMRRDAPGMTVDDSEVGPFGNGYLEIAAEQMLHQHPHLDAVVALNVESGLATAAALRARRLQNTVHVIVFDASLQAFSLLREGEFDSLVVQDARAIGNAAVQAIVDDRNGKATQETKYFRPRLVTRDNIDHEDIQQFLLMHWRRP